MLELADQRILLVAVETGIGANRPLEALEAVARDATLFQRPVEAAEIAVAPQKRQIRLADDDVVGRGVVVQFLMPLLDENAARLLEMIAVHDVQNFVADALALAAAAQRREHQASPPARPRPVPPPDIRQAHR